MILKVGSICELQAIFCFLIHGFFEPIGYFTSTRVNFFVGHKLLIMTNALNFNDRYYR
jgi:hypothetical protein